MDSFFLSSIYGPQKQQKLVFNKNDETALSHDLHIKSKCDSNTCTFYSGGLYDLTSSSRLNTTRNVFWKTGLPLLQSWLSLWTPQVPLLSSSYSRQSLACSSLPSNNTFSTLDPTSIFGMLFIYIRDYISLNLLSSFHELCRSIKYFSHSSIMTFFFNFRTHVKLVHK